ncbi:MAG: Maf family protein [bacterium]
MNPNSLLNLNGRPLILASGSPRRASLLKLVGFEFEVKASQLDERNEAYAVPEVHVLELSQKKAWKVAETIKDGLIVGADTIVVLDSQILGKPDSPAQAREMLRRLSGYTHTVYTGLAIVAQPGGRTISDYEKTDVTFRNLSDTEIEQYVETKSPLDKAGSYGIQDQGALFVSKVNGCFYNVMGFPLSKFYSLLRSFVKLKQCGVTRDK